MSAGQQNCQENKWVALSHVHVTFHNIELRYNITIHHIPCDMICGRYTTFHFQSMNCLVMTRCRGQRDTAGRRNCSRKQTSCSFTRPRCSTTTIQNCPCHHSTTHLTFWHPRPRFSFAKQVAVVYFRCCLLSSVILIHFHMFWSLWWNAPFEPIIEEMRRNKSTVKRNISLTKCSI